jgi:hypothetical protein
MCFVEATTSTTKRISNNFEKIFEQKSAFGTKSGKKIKNNFQITKINVDLRYIFQKIEISKHEYHKTKCY